MKIFSCKVILFLILLLIFPSKTVFSSIILSQTTKMNIPSKRSFTQNTEFIRPFKFKKITIAEYITDPIIMYTGLWACFATTLPLWEINSGLSEGDTNYYYPDSLRGFDKIYDDPTYNSTNNMSIDNTFADRLKMEPFATGRIDPLTKTQSFRNLGYYPDTGEFYYFDDKMTVFRTDFYAKNFVEPAYFTYLALYMRAKNYHPAIMITEIILLSLLYEITIRPFYMTSSFEQLFKNPGIALVFGIFLDELSTFLLTTPYKGLHVLAYFLNPFNGLPNSRIHPMLFFDPFRKTASIEAIIRL